MKLKRLDIIIKNNKNYWHRTYELGSRQVTGST